MAPSIMWAEAPVQLGEPIDTIDLPAAPRAGDVSIEEAIRNRRSVRSFRDKVVSLDKISRLLFAAQGITEPELGLRSAPSAGATYPLEVFVVTDDYFGRYKPAMHRLAILQNRDIRKPLSEACLGQSWVEEAPVVFVFVAEVARTADRYGTKRAERYVNIEVGCAAENLMLQAAALGLGSVPVGAFWDDEVHEVLDLPGEWVVLLVVPVGVPVD
jgi:SagB-type dehydrogenase family enzyme